MAPPKQRTTTVRGVSGKLFDSPPTASSDGLVCILRASPSPPTSTSAFTVTAFSSTGDELAALNEKGGQVFHQWVERLVNASEEELVEIFAGEQRQAAE